jgi:uncharacterized LabA/DUF88 family protein
MAGSDGKRLVRIGMFIDGGYFDEVSRYYKFGHARGTRLSLDGLQRFIRKTVADWEESELSLCPIVEAHYFRGRFSANDAEAAGKLKDQAVFDDVLIRTDIHQHYLPVSTNTGQPPKERGVDLRLALEVYDMAVHGRFDVVALVACDSDYVPLLRKLAETGVRTLVLAWDFRYEFDDLQGRRRLKETRTSQALIEACTYPVMMTALIDDRSRKDEQLVQQLFV